MGSHYTGKQRRNQKSGHHAAENIHCRPQLAGADQAVAQSKAAECRGGGIEGIGEMNGMKNDE